MGKYIRMKKFIKKIMMPLVFSLLMVIYTLGSSITLGDTEAFKSYAREYNYHYLSFAISRYISWSSRFLIEAITAYFSVHYIQFFVLIFLLSFLLMVSFVRLIGFDENKYLKYKLIVPTLAIFFFPINRLFDSAGVIATMTNYYVPMCLMAYSLLVFKKETRPYGYVFKLLGFIFVVQQEQFALLSFIVFFTAIVYQLTQKISVKKYIPFLFLSVMGILSVKLSPGNTKRTITEIKEHFPEFANISLLRKLDVGFIRMTYDLLFNGEVTLFLILMLVSILIYAILKKKINQSIGLVTILTMIILPYLHIWTPVSKMKVIYDSFPKGVHGDILSITGNTAMSVYPDIVMILMLVVILAIIWTVLTSYRDRVIVFTLLISGTATKMMLGLSPTVSISGIRTFVPMIFCGFIITIYFAKLALDEIIENNKEAKIKSNS